MNLNWIRIPNFAVAVAVVLIGLQCGPATTMEPNPESGAVAAIHSETEESPGLPAGLQKDVEADPRFNELARYISGQELDGDATLKALTENGTYRAYQKRIRTAWARYEENHLTPMRAWNPTLTGKGCGPQVFYPFSGPDITHAVLLFPNAPTYILFGLEPVGPIPGPAGGGESEARKLGAVDEAVRDVLGRNFFKTIDMAVEVGQNDYSGVAGLLLFFLGNLDYEVLNGFPVYIAEDGSIQESIADVPAVKAASKTAKVASSETQTGVTYFFRKRGGPIQQVTYFSINLADGAFGTNVKNFLRGRREIVTMLKAASYLMYRPGFDGMRSTILGRSNCILTDSSGVPFHYMNNARWNVELFGVYRRPVPLFKTRFQPDLFLELKARNPERMSFSYGYNYGPGLSHLIFAVRDRARNPWFAPEFDDSTSIGENTVWLAESRQMVYERKFTAEAIRLSDSESAETQHERPSLNKKK